MDYTCAACYGLSSINVPFFFSSSLKLTVPTLTYTGNEMIFFWTEVNIFLFAFQNQYESQK